MPRSGLDREQIVAAASRLVEERGAEGFSVRVLAERLDIRPASLYHHVESMEALLGAVCLDALRRLYQAEVSAIGGKRGDEAVFALADSHRRFAREHRELYRLIMHRAASREDRAEVSRCVTEPFFRVLEGRNLTEKERIHWQRVLRGIVHGFVSQEEAGFFAHMEADGEDSFRTAINCYLDGLRQAEGRGTR